MLKQLKVSNKNQVNRFFSNRNLSVLSETSFFVTKVSETSIEIICSLVGDVKIVWCIIILIVIALKIEVHEP